MDVKNWFVPTITFVLFLYCMIFAIIYVIKVGGSNVSFYNETQKSAKPVNEAGQLLKEIGQNFGN